MQKQKNKLETLELSQLIKLRTKLDQNERSAIYEELCIIGHNIKLSTLSDFTLLHRPTRMNILLFCLCLEGDTIIQCDMQEANIKSNTLFICKPGSIIQPITHGTEMVSVIILDANYKLQPSMSIQKLLPHYDSLEKLNVVELSSEESCRLNSLIGYLYDSIISNSNNLFYHERIKSLFASITYDVLYRFTRDLCQVKQLESKKFTRQQVYFHEFVNLLGLHFKEERRVEYYADRLHITSKYLGTLVMQHTGRSASHWISSYVMSEARALLLHTPMSIQEIAFSLNFPNQSFFGKYFKSHQGVTPGEFRRQQMSK